MADRRSETVSIVLVGSFNPAIVHPRWPELFALLRPWGLENPDQVKAEIVHPEITKLSFGNAVIEVEPTKFQVRDSDASRRVADFCLGLFGVTLVHTPIWAIGINYDVEMEVQSGGARDRIGYALAPAEAWGELAKSMKSEKGGLLNLTVRCPVDQAGYLERYRDIRVMPHLGDRKRFFVKTNSHFQLAKKEEPVSAGPNIQNVLGNFEREVQVARETADHIWNIGAN